MAITTESPRPALTALRRQHHSGAATQKVTRYATPAAFSSNSTVSSARSPSRPTSSKNATAEAATPSPSAPALPLVHRKRHPARTRSRKRPPQRPPRAKPTASSTPNPHLPCRDPQTAVPRPEAHPPATGPRSREYQRAASSLSLPPHLNPPRSRTQAAHPLRARSPMWRRSGRGAIRERG